MTKSNELKPFQVPGFVLLRNGSPLAFSKDKSTIEALRHGEDETIIEGWFVNTRPQQLESLDKNKLDELIKEYFGYKDISAPVYNYRIGCSLTDFIFNAFSTPKEVSVEQIAECLHINWYRGLDHASREYNLAQELHKLIYGER